MDLEGSGPAAGLLRPPPAASPIAQERVAPGRPDFGFVLAALVLGAATTVVAIALAMRGPAVPAESLAAADPFGVANLGLAAGRLLAACGAGLAVAGVAVAGRRLSHSGPAGLLAAALVALDPAFLLQGSLGVPLAVEAAALAWALAFATSPVPLLHWMSGVSLAVAALVDPVAALWVLPLAAFLLLRGHIYAAPQHFALALAQVAILPLAAVALHVVVAGDLALAPACLSLGLGSRLALLQLAQPGPALLLLPDPVVWLAGAGTLAAFGLGGLGFAVARFRIARAPGRLQVRLVSPIPAVLARGSWLLVLAVAAPPAAWIALFAIALAMGIRELGEDAPGFGLAVALVLLGFAGLVLARAWGALAGDPGGIDQALRLVPWAETVGC